MLVVLLVGVQVSTAQISGKIIDATDNSPLEYATAALYNQTDGSLITGVVTSQDGSFVIDKVKPEPIIWKPPLWGTIPKPYPILR